MNVKLTAPQEKMLREIVATNGGGIAEFKLSHATLKVLIRKGLVQGKKGQQWRAVHTPEGFAWVTMADFIF